MLDALAAALLERETLEREEILLVASGKPLPPRREAPLLEPGAPAAPVAQKTAAPAPFVPPKEAPSPA